MRHHGDILTLGCVCNTHCFTGERRAAFATTVYVPRHTGTAGTLIHIPLFVGVICGPLVQTWRHWVCSTNTQLSSTELSPKDTAVGVHLLSLIPWHSSQHFPGIFTGFWPFAQTSSKHSSMLHSMWPNWECVQTEQIASEVCTKHDVYDCPCHPWHILKTFFFPDLELNCTYFPLLCIIFQVNVLKKRQNKKPQSLLETFHEEL